MELIPSPVAVRRAPSMFSIRSDRKISRRDFPRHHERFANCSACRNNHSDQWNLYLRPWQCDARLLCFQSDLTGKYLVVTSHGITNALQIVPLAGITTVTNGTYTFARGSATRAFYVFNPI